MVYIDFGGTNCHPCVEEIPHSTDFKMRILAKHHVLLTGIQFAINNWKKSIQRFDFSGNQLLLSRNEYAALSSKFQISGIPRYVLMDKTGQVADIDARRPSDKKLPADINKLLAL